MPFIPVPQDNHHHVFLWIPHKLIPEVCLRCQTIIFLSIYIHFRNKSNEHATPQTGFSELNIKRKHLEKCGDSVVIQFVFTTSLKTQQDANTFPEKESGRQARRG